MNEDGQINEAHSISAGLDYPGTGPSTPGSTMPGRVYLPFGVPMTRR